MTEKNYVKGKVNGEVISYYNGPGKSRGPKSKECKYINGRIEGWSIGYWPDGREQYRNEYKNGKIIK